MATIGYEDIVDVMLNISDPNTGAAVSEVPGVSSPKINGATSIYNVEVEGGLGIAGWSTDVKWTPAVGSISWTSGKIYLPDGTEISISSGSATVSSSTYIYVDTESGTVSSSSHGYDAVGENKIMICAAFPNSGKNVTFKAFGCGDQSSLVSGSDIAARTIVASNIASGEITANEIHSNTITASEIASGAITSSKIDAGAVTAAKIDVSQLSAISANLGTITAGDITGTTVTAGSTSGTAVKLDPSSQSIKFYRSGSSVGEIYGGNVNGGGAIRVDASIFGMSSGTMVAGGKLRIPVGNNLYN